MRLIDAEQYEERINAHINAIESCPATSSVEKNKELRQWKDALYDLRRMSTVNPYEWISVEDRLPEKEGRYLVVEKNKYGKTTIDMRYLLYWANGPDWSMSWQDRDVHGIKITHWMPLPDSPK